MTSTRPLSPAALPPFPAGRRSRFLLGGLLAIALTGGAACLPAAADEPARTPTDDDYLLQEDDPASREVPKFRLELSARGVWLVDAKFKKGRAGTASTIDTGKDLHMPVVPFAGVRAVFDIKFHPDALIGVHYTALEFRGTKRLLHKGGSSFQGRTFAPEAPTRTILDFQLSDVFFRFPARDNPRLRFAFGFGVAWARLRARLEAPTVRARGRVQEFFGPTLNYMVSAQIHPHALVFLESVTAVISPLGFPSYVSEFRAGLRIPLPLDAELIAAFSTQSAWLEKGHDLWDSAPTANRKMRSASWTIMGGDLGLSIRF